MFWYSRVSIWGRVSLFLILSVSNTLLFLCEISTKVVYIQLRFLVILFFFLNYCCANLTKNIYMGVYQVYRCNTNKL